jgi:hypothetical protein
MTAGVLRFEACHVEDIGQRIETVLAGKVACPGIVRHIFKRVFYNNSL